MSTFDGNRREESSTMESYGSRARFGFEINSHKAGKTVNFLVLVPLRKPTYGSWERLEERQTSQSIAKTT